MDRINFGSSQRTYLLLRSTLTLAVVLAAAAPPLRAQQSSSADSALVRWEVLYGTPDGVEVRSPVVLGSSLQPFVALPSVTSTSPNSFIVVGDIEGPFSGVDEIHVVWDKQGRASELRLIYRNILREEAMTSLLNRLLTRMPFDREADAQVWGNKFVIVRMVRSDRELRFSVEPHESSH